MSRAASHGLRVAPSGLWTVVPVRGIATGKSRLAGVLDPEARARLNRRLLEHTLRVVSDWRGDLSCCAVVTSCPEARAMAARSGAVVVEEGGDSRGLNAAAALGTAGAGERGAEKALVLACDLPYLNADALSAMLDASPQHGIVIAPDRHGTGTNALLVSAREPFDFRFGEKSCASHLALADERGWRAVLCRRPELEFDLDTAEDLARWTGDIVSRPGSHVATDEHG